MAELEAATVAELGERGLLERIARGLGPPPSGEVWSGDDAAVFPAPSDNLVYTTDMLVEGVDFDLSYSDGSDVGWKLVACNASDAAAMGANPRYALVTLALPGATPVSLVDAFLAGLQLAATRWGIAIVGGDISSSPVVSASLALIASPLPGGVTLRSGAAPGDALCTTGSLGGAAGGLIALRERLVDPDAVRAEIASPSGADALAVLAARHLRPQARVQEADRLGRTVGLAAAIDVSDGLALDLARVCRASKVGCIVDPGAVPADPELAFLSARSSAPVPDPLTLALTGGEDFELLFALDPAKVERAQLALDEIGVPVTRIGEVTDGDLRLGDEPLDDWIEAGWDHLRTP